MFVKCIKDISDFKTGKCYAVVTGHEYDSSFTLYDHRGCSYEERLPLENFEIVRVQREEVFSYLIRENEHDCPLDVALEYSYKDGITDQFFCSPTPTQERYLLHKLEDWADAWNREPW
jgi:hypothetical protein